MGVFGEEPCKSVVIFGFYGVKNPQYIFYPNFIAPGEARGGAQHLGEVSGSREGGRDLKAPENAVA